MDQSRLTIDIYLDEDDTLFRNFDAPNDYHLSRDIEDYILSKFTHNFKRKVEINFYNTEESSSVVEAAVMNTFRDRVEGIRHEHRANNVKAIILFILGFLIGFIFLWISNAELEMFAASVSIVSWVLIWAGTEIYFFDNLKIRGFMNKCDSILKSKINVK